jgi:Tol biopolymer transport system component
VWARRTNETNWVQIVSYENEVDYPDPTAWSPDSTLLVVQDRAETVWLYQAGNWSERTILYDDDYGVQLLGAVWSPDGRYLALVGLGGELILIRSDGSGVEMLLEEGSVGTVPGSSASDIAWSPDSRQIAYWASWDVLPPDLELWGIDIEARSQHLLCAPELEFNRPGPIWSPDGRQIAFDVLRDGRWGVAFLDVESLDMRTVYLPEALQGYLYDLTWAPDRSHLAMIASPSLVNLAEDVWLLSVESSEAYQLTSAGYYTRIIRWSEEGIITLTSNNTIEVIEVQQ